MGKAFVEVLLLVPGRFVLMRDTGDIEDMGGMTRIADCASSVTHDCYAMWGVTGIFYLDSLGELWELVHVGEEFERIAPGIMSGPAAEAVGVAYDMVEEVAQPRDGWVLDLLHRILGMQHA